MIPYYHLIWSVTQFFIPCLCCYCCYAPDADAGAVASDNANANASAEVVGNAVNHPAPIELIIDSCVVCQSEFENDDELSLLPCSHAFHTECIGTWLRNNPSCPLCRSVVTDSNHPSGLESHSSSDSLRVEIGNLSDRQISSGRRSISVVVDGASYEHIVEENSVVPLRETTRREIRSSSASPFRNTRREIGSSSTSQQRSEGSPEIIICSSMEEVKHHFETRARGEWVLKIHSSVSPGEREKMIRYATTKGIPIK